MKNPNSLYWPASAVAPTPAPVISSLTASNSIRIFPNCYKIIKTKIKRKICVAKLIRSAKLLQVDQNECIPSPSISNVLLKQLNAVYVSKLDDLTPSYLDEKELKKIEVKLVDFSNIPLSLSQHYLSSRSGYITLEDQIFLNRIHHTDSALYLKYQNVTDSYLNILMHPTSRDVVGKIEPGEVFKVYEIVQAVNRSIYVRSESGWVLGQKSSFTPTENELIENTFDNEKWHSAGNEMAEQTFVKTIEVIRDSTDTTVPLSKSRFQKLENINQSRVTADLKEASPVSVINKGLTYDITCSNQEVSVSSPKNSVSGVSFDDSGCNGKHCSNCHSKSSDVSSNIYPKPSQDYNLQCPPFFVYQVNKCVRLKILNDVNLDKTIPQASSSKSNICESDLLGAENLKKKTEAQKCTCCYNLISSARKKKLNDKLPLSYLCSDPFLHLSASFTSSSHYKYLEPLQYFLVYDFQLSKNSVLLLLTNYGWVSCACISPNGNSLIRLAHRVDEGEMSYWSPKLYSYIGSSTIKVYADLDDPKSVLRHLPSGTFFEVFERRYNIRRHMFLRLIDGWILERNIKSKYCSDKELNCIQIPDFRKEQQVETILWAFKYIIIDMLRQANCLNTNLYSTECFNDNFKELIQNYFKGIEQNDQSVKLAALENNNLQATKNQINMDTYEELFTLFNNNTCDVQNSNFQSPLYLDPLFIMLYSSYPSLPRHTNSNTNLSLHILNSIFQHTFFQSNKGYWRSQFQESFLTHEFSNFRQQEKCVANMSALCRSKQHDSAVAFSNLNKTKNRFNRLKNKNTKKDDDKCDNAHSFNTSDTNSALSNIPNEVKSPVSSPKPCTSSIKEPSLVKSEMIAKAYMNDSKNGIADNNLANDSMITEPSAVNLEELPSIANIDGFQPKCSSESTNLHKSMQSLNSSYMSSQADTPSSVHSSAVEDLPNVEDGVAIHNVDIASKNLEVPCENINLNSSPPFQTISEIPNSLHHLKNISHFQNHNETLAANAYKVSTDMKNCAAENVELTLNKQIFNTVTQHQQILEDCPPITYGLNEPLQFPLSLGVSIHIKLLIKIASSLPHYTRYNGLGVWYESIKLDSPYYQFVMMAILTSLSAHCSALSSLNASQIPQLCIKNIERIHNPPLLDEYIARRNRTHGSNIKGCTPILNFNPILKAENDLDVNLNEVFLFHGCDNSKVDQICQVGFDPRRAGLNRGRLFGVGTYFAENMSKADLYTCHTATANQRYRLRNVNPALYSSSSFKTSPSFQTHLHPNTSPLLPSFHVSSHLNSRSNLFPSLRSYLHQKLKKIKFNSTDGSISHILKKIKLKKKSAPIQPLFQSKIDHSSKCKQSISNQNPLIRSKSFTHQKMDTSISRTLSCPNFSNCRNSGQGQVINTGTSRHSSDTSSSDTSSSSDSNASISAPRVMVLSRVCLGEIYYTLRTMPEAQMPPFREDSEVTKDNPYDSVCAESRTCGGLVNFREFITYERGQALPLFRVTYFHSPTCKCVDCMKS